jgi:hypothetical protein
MSTEFQALFSQFDDTDTYKAMFDGESLFVTTQKAVCKKVVHAGTLSLRSESFWIEADQVWPTESWREYVLEG